ncbi:MAG: N(G),N(G)-dimethylarginine dimethylaminohydrolase [Gemmatimonadota bacterium]|nr:MAG: N(G),N(G)-dimethylarginine dimethylaminohydrolase [Gemmatimonadota bacterium]
MQTPSGTFALVRGVPKTFHRAITPSESTEPIDVERAREQHERYCQALEGLGLKLIRIAADDRFPDCPFVEDTALVLGDRVIITAPGAEARRGETGAIEQALENYMTLYHIQSPATLDGGDILLIDEHVYVGLSSRTSSLAAEQLRQILADTRYDVTPVAVDGILHLKSACTYLGDDVIVYLPGHLDDDFFARYERITVPRNEAHAANCLSINGTVLVPAGAPETRAHIENAGFDTLEIDISESHKVGGGLTCSCIIF